MGNEPWVATDKSFINYWHGKAAHTFGWGFFNRPEPSKWNMPLLFSWGSQVCAQSEFNVGYSLPKSTMDGATLSNRLPGRYCVWSNRAICQSHDRIINFIPVTVRVKLSKFFWSISILRGDDAGNGDDDEWASTLIELHTSVTSWFGRAIWFVPVEKKGIMIIMTRL